MSRVYTSTRNARLHYTPKSESACGTRASSRNAWDIIPLQRVDALRRMRSHYSGSFGRGDVARPCAFEQLLSSRGKEGILFAREGGQEVGERACIAPADTAPILCSPRTFSFVRGPILRLWGIMLAARGMYGLSMYMIPRRPATSLLCTLASIMPGASRVRYFPVPEWIAPEAAGIWTAWGRAEDGTAISRYF